MYRILKITAAALIVATSALAAPATARATLVHRYSFNDNTANDSIGQANGTLVGGVTISGGQAHFDGAPTQRIALLASGAQGIGINMYDAVTFEAWYSADKANLWQRLFDLGASKNVDDPQSTGAQCVNYIVNAGYSKEGGAAATLSNVDPSYTDESAAKAVAAPLNQEVHVAVVVDSDHITLFIDGAQVAQDALGSRTLAKLSNDYALLGHSLYGSNPSFSGSINEFRIYRGAATPAEIAASFKAGPDHLVVGASK